ncbi:hypothetical protein B0H14DRAFT_2581802 [Mycena olivaceomarginata]|nr:hypothetical protein B0H14DRAFT_2581802 [Mycena olivaceomarginata]
MPLPPPPRLPFPAPFKFHARVTSQEEGKILSNSSPPPTPQWHARFGSQPTPRTSPFPTSSGPPTQPRSHQLQRMPPSAPKALHEAQNANAIADSSSGSARGGAPCFNGMDYIKSAFGELICSGSSAILQTALCADNAFLWCSKADPDSLVHEFKPAAQMGMCRKAWFFPSRKTLLAPADDATREYPWDSPALSSEFKPVCHTGYAIVVGKNQVHLGCLLDYQTPDPPEPKQREEMGLYFHLRLSG